MNHQQLTSNKYIGCLLGTAVGDAIGLPCEGLSRRRRQRLYPDVARHHLIFGKGMISDDTEHTCMVAQSLLVAGEDDKKFARALAWRLRCWLLGLPAGVGYATLRAIVRLWLGFGFDRSGVFSAGNGPAMRSAILGVCYGGDRDRLRQWVRIATRMTHTDPKAEYGALAVAIAAHLSSQHVSLTPDEYLHHLQRSLDDAATEFLTLIERACHSAAVDETAVSFADDLGLSRGVGGYVYHTVPVVIQIWLRHQADYHSAIAEIVALGGDTDTTAAIVGGIIGARVGKNGIPQPWLDALWEWPRTVRWMETLGTRLSMQQSNLSPLPEQHRIQSTALPLPLGSILLRNLFFLIVVIFHGFRRLLPPY